jgi:hypothetical protein
MKLDDGGKEYTLHVQTADGGKRYVILTARLLYTRGAAGAILDIFDIEKCQNAGLKVSPALAFLTLVNCLSPASAFRHQGQYRTTGLRPVWHHPAMLIVR